MFTPFRVVTCFLVTIVAAVAADAAPTEVQHDPASIAFGTATTQLDPIAPVQDELATVRFRVSFQFTYDRVALYYTTDGSTPIGSFGVGAGSTQVLTNAAGTVVFESNETTPQGTRDWWQAPLPADTQNSGTPVRYRLGAWDTGSGPEVFAPSVFEFTNALAWPGAGASQPDPQAGYPPVHFWKEEAVAGNGSITTMLDQNGSLYDIYHPSAGAVNGISTTNEGYFDNFNDQFPPSLSSMQRGQMHLNQAQVGVRVNGLTYWLSNPGDDLVDHEQNWSGNTNVISSTSRLASGSSNIRIEQHDFAPLGTTFPLFDDALTPNRHIHIKRVVLTNLGDATTANIYFHADWALNGGDAFDQAFTDAPRGAMVAFDNTARFTSSSGEYNPTTFGDYQKAVSVYLAFAMKLAPDVGSAGGTVATDFWSDTSTDTDQGWIGLAVNLPAGASREVDIAIVGGFDDFPNASATYAFQMDDAVNWFIAQSAQSLQQQTEQAWTDWLAGGVGFDSPEPDVNETFNRGLLGTALHLDHAGGGVVAGMHNGAYPFVWPRDAAWAAITLARTGFTDEAQRVFDFLSLVAYRDVENWPDIGPRKGFWKQKYTTDGFTVWAAPQVDETSAVPWAARYYFDITGDIAFLESMYDEVFEACISSTRDSLVDNRLRYEESTDLVYSMNLWEDSFDVFNYSNASVVRALEDAAAIADILDQNACPGGPGTCNYHNDRAMFLGLAATIRAGLDARLAWNGENNDISQLGISFPFEIYPAGHPRTELILDRINGNAADTFGNFQPLTQSGPAGGQPLEWLGMVDRYWNDGYWNGGPWFLTTLWYGSYHAKRNDVTSGKSDIDVHKSMLDLMVDARGPMGFGAEQIARFDTLLYPAQTDFRLQAAFPNAWESMSFLVDSIMLFLDLDPDASGNTLRIRPKLPSDWPFMTYTNVHLGAHRIDIDIRETADAFVHTFTNHTGNPLDFDTVVRVLPGSPAPTVSRNGVPVAFTHDDLLGTVAVAGPLATGPAALTEIRVTFAPACPCDWDGSGVLNSDDFFSFLTDFFAGSADFNADSVTNSDDFFSFLNCFFGGC